ncbi:MAG: type VI secretion system baseplate subunit TssE [Planctomycetota bacterium]
MSASADARPELPSVLDRLIDDDPQSQGERPLTVKEMAAELRRAVRRDLEELLNTRLRPRTVAPELEVVAASSYEYGVPDVSAANLSTKASRKKYLKALEEIIRRHEPRVSSVKVVPVEDGRVADRALRFRIDAVLRTEPLPESVLYDSDVDIFTRQVSIAD